MTEMLSKDRPILYMVSPCYNEHEVLPTSHKLFLDALDKMIADGAVSPASKIIFVNDGSKDETWQIIKALSDAHPSIEGLSLSSNRGHQNALMAGMMFAMNRCDVCVSLDCDGQHDPSYIPEMLRRYEAGADVVYAVRTSRDTDGLFKKFSSQGFYSLMNMMGVNIARNAADFRLMSSRALRALSEYRETNLFLRGLIPLIGFNQVMIEYECAERLAGHSHYSLKKMLTLASDGITSMSVRPLSMISAIGFVTTFVGIIWVIYVLIMSVVGSVVQGWASTLCAICLFGGVQLLAIGVIGEYIGKIYLEVKRRPRYHISERTVD